MLRNEDGKYLTGVQQANKQIEQSIKTANEILQQNQQTDNS